MRSPLAFTHALLTLVLVTSISASGEEEKSPGGELPQVLEERFENGLARWEMTDPKAWAAGEDEGKKVMILKGGSDYEPPVRSPLNIARIKGLSLTDFVADFHAKQTGREYGHRDLCFFFGYQGPANFYYVHLASVADDHANSIFLVNDAPRVSIAAERTSGTAWSQGYHHIRIKRTTATGRIEVYFDDMEKPVMVADDKTFTHGGMGVGSFDDEGIFREVSIWGTSTKDGAAAPEAMH